MTSTIKLNTFWNKHSPLIILILLLGIYLATSTFIALNLQPGIIPDEPAHFIFSKHFASTPGIPRDTVETYSWGWYIRQNPFLYHWFNGRIINLVRWISPEIPDSSLIIALRLTNVLYGLGTILFCFFLSKEVIQGRWWQLLPVFLLTQTLMFVFLSGGINYDNLVNLLCMAGLFFLIRTFNNKAFLANSLMWFIMIALGTLAKFTVLPLALAMSLAWGVFLIKRRKNLAPLHFKSPRNIPMILIAMLLILGNFAIYGVNLIRYQSITPRCQEILLESQCEVNPYARRTEEIALNQKLSIRESIDQGFPSPIRYALVDWVWHMLNRSFGMIGHQSYFPLHLILFYQFWFYLIVTLGIFNLAYYQKISFTSLSLVWISLFYTGVLFFQNYNSELVYGFKQIALQGRYIFPIIGALYVLVTKIIKFMPISLVKWSSVIITIALLLIGGPVTVFIGLDSFLVNWFSF